MKIPNYAFEHDKLRETNKVSRTGMYIRSDIAYTCAHYLENDQSSCVTIYVGFPNKTKITGIRYYHQWSELFSKDKTRDIINEAKKVEDITSKWINQIKKEEMIIVGDFNVHNRAILANEESKTPYEKSLNKISNIFKKNLCDNGMVIINKRNTYQSGLIKSDHDIQMTNRPEKIKNFGQDDYAPSDHSLLYLQRHMKIRNSEEQYIMYLCIVLQ